MDWWGQGFDSPPASRVVTPETATYLVPVFAAIRHIVDFTSTLSLAASRDNGDGTRSDVSLPQFLLAQNQAGRAGLEQFVGQAVYGMVTTGNAVGWIVNVDGNGNPTDIVWLPRQRWDWDEATKQWRVDGTVVNSSRIAHIPWIVPSGRKLGLGPIDHFKATVSAGLSAQEYADVKRGGGIPPVILKNQTTTLTPEQAETIKRRAKASFAGSEPFVTGADWDLTAVTIPPNQAQFIETMKMSANQIAAIYGLEPREVGGETQSSDTLKYVNDESLMLNRISNVRPYFTRLEAAFSRWMPLKQYVRFCTDDTYRVDKKTNVEIDQIELAMGTKNRNEIRAKYDLPPIPGGDKYNTSSAPPAPLPNPDASGGKTP
jgi:HK97 family phage portal protein